MNKFKQIYTGLHTLHLEKHFETTKTQRSWPESTREGAEHAPLNQST